MKNKAGDKMNVGKGTGALNYYCGKELPRALRNLMPSNDGRCGPDNGPQCPNCNGYTKTKSKIMSKIT